MPKAWKAVLDWSSYRQRLRYIAVVKSSVEGLKLAWRIAKKHSDGMVSCLSTARSRWLSLLGFPHARLSAAAAP